MLTYGNFFGKSAPVNTADKESYFYDFYRLFVLTSLLFKTFETTKLSVFHQNLLSSVNL